MEKDNGFLDISLLKNQVKLAVMISNILTIDELDFLMNSVENITINDDVKENSTDQFEILFDKYCSEYKNIQLLDIFLADKNASVRYIVLRIRCQSYFQSDFKFKYSKNLKNFIYVIFGKAINFLNYKSYGDNSYIYNNIINNFAVELSKNNSTRVLEELRSVINYLPTEIGGDDNNTFEFSIEETKFRLITKLSVVRFEFIVGNKIYYYYLKKTQIGQSTLSLIIEIAINSKFN